MDTTYFRRSGGVLLLRDAHSGRNLYWLHVKHETNELYAQGLAWLKENGVVVQGVCSTNCVN